MVTNSGALYIYSAHKQKLIDMTLKTLYITLVSCLVSFSYAYGEILNIDNFEDYSALENFFKAEFEDEGYSYVLDGVKTITHQFFKPLDEILPGDVERTKNLFSKTLYLRDMLPVWEKLNLSKDKFILKIDYYVHGDIEKGGEVTFINVQKLKDVIQENIILIKYILGPTTTPEKLFQRLAYSNEFFYDILEDNPTLVGIMLGYGTNNSLLGGRTDTLHAALFDQDIPPNKSKGAIYTDNKEHYFHNYLTLNGKNEGSLNIPSCKHAHGFKSSKDELNTIQLLGEELPDCLSDKPRYVCGAYKGDNSNPEFFKRLVSSQKKSQEILAKGNILPYVLEKMGYPDILVVNNTSGNPNSALAKPTIQSCLQTIEKHISSYTTEQKLAFLNSFYLNKDPDFSTLCFIHNMKENLALSLNNLEKANSNFTIYHNDKLLTVLLPNKLYYKIVSEGVGKDIGNNNSIRVQHISRDNRGTILRADHDIWLKLSDTIPGFAHGVKSMKIGEEREIYIHPSLAYGILTSLPLCSEIVINVKLLDFKEDKIIAIPPLEPQELDWIKNPLYKNEIDQSEEAHPSLCGSFYRKILNMYDMREMDNLLFQIKNIINVLE